MPLLYLSLRSRGSLSKRLEPIWLPILPPFWGSISSGALDTLPGQRRAPQIAPQDLRSIPSRPSRLAAHARRAAGGQSLAVALASAQASGAGHARHARLGPATGEQHD
jgi:hypothetical protein